MLNKSRLYGLIGEKFTFLTLKYLTENKKDLIDYIPGLQIKKKLFKENIIKKRLTDYSISNPLNLILNNKKFEMHLDFFEEWTLYKKLANKNGRINLFYLDFFAKNLYQKLFNTYYDPSEEEKKHIMDKSNIYLKNLQEKLTELKKEDLNLNSKIRGVIPLKLKSKQLYLLSQNKILYPDFQVSFANTQNKAYAEVKTHYPQSLEKIIHADEYTKENQIFNDKLDYEKPISETLVKKIIEKYSSDTARWNSSKSVISKTPYIEGFIFLHQKTPQHLDKILFHHETPSLILVIDANDFYSILNKIDKEISTNFSSYYKEFILRPNKFLSKNYFNFQEESAKISEQQLVLF